MSEITKACETCKGSGDAPGFLPGHPCKPCSGTGRVPDVEATLRAEVARLTEERDKALAKGAKALKSCAEWMHRAVALENAEHKWETLAECRAEVTRLTATLAERDGEVARLEGREREASAIMANDRDGRYSYEYRDESRAAWLAGCKS